MERFIRGLAWTVGILLAIALLLRATLLEHWRVPEDARMAASVAPSLAGGDLVLVLTRGSLGFGDLVRCKDPEDATSFVVGRIAGVEGDVVEAAGTRLSVNGKRYDATTACDQPTFVVPHPTTGSEMEMRCDVVDMGGGWHYRAHFPKAGVLTKATKVQVGAGMVYLLSDNRELHDDSRDFGPIERASCSGRITFRLIGKAGWSDSRSRLSYIR